MLWTACQSRLLDHRKTIRLMIAMCWGRGTTVGTLQIFWHWCLRQAIDGDLRPFTPEEIAYGAEVPPQDVQKFLAAMIQAGFIDKEPYLRVHDWWGNMGKFLKTSLKRTPEVWERIAIAYGYDPEEERRGRDQVADSAPPEKKREEKKTKQDITKQKKTEQQQQQHPPLQNKREDDDADDDHDAAAAAACVTSPRNDPHEMPRQLWTGGATELQDEQKLHQMLHKCVGANKVISYTDMQRIKKLRHTHGPRFYEACDRLHGGVENVAGYLKAVLEPVDTTESLIEEVEALARKEGIIP